MQTELKLAAVRLNYIYPGEVQSSRKFLPEEKESFIIIITVCLLSLFVLLLKNIYYHYYHCHRYFLQIARIYLVITAQKWHLKKMFFLSCHWNEQNKTNKTYTNKSRKPNLTTIYISNFNVTILETQLSSSNFSMILTMTILVDFYFGIFAYLFQRNRPFVFFQTRHRYTSLYHFTKEWACASFFSETPTTALVFPCAQLGAGQDGTGVSIPKNIPISQRPLSLFTDLERNSFVITFCPWNDEKQHYAHWEKHLRKIKR